MVVLRRATTAVLAAALGIALPLAGPAPAGAGTGSPSTADVGMDVRASTHASAGVRIGAGSAVATLPGNTSVRRHPTGTVPALPLGPAGLTQTATRERLGPGVRLTTVVRGRASSQDSWVLRSLQPTRAAADDLAARIRAQGRPATVQRIDERAADDPASGPLGWLVVSSGYPTEAAAQRAGAELARSGVTGLGVSNTALYRTDATGPWVVRILTVDRRKLRQVRAHLATDVVPGRETTSAVAQRLGAVAAVNGGYFVVGSADGVPGDLAGVAVQDGRFDSEAVADRAALVVDGRATVIAAVTTRLRLTSSDGAVETLDGVDRSIGRVRDCGAPGNQPTERPQQDITCTNPDDIVAFDGAYGQTAEEGPGVAVTLDRRGRVLEVRRERGGAIPAHGRVVEAIGAGATWLTEHAQVGRTLRVTKVLRAAGRRLVLRHRTGIVNGGPFLVRAGRVDVDAWHEGFVHPDDPAFYFGFGVSRNPRTMAGLTRRGVLVLVTVDGRAPGYSIGMSFAEQARVMHALGARVALNLDGGGSTTMAVRGRLVGRPSDTTGERPVGDVVTVLSGSRR
ncbi:MAG TPA: phosphodiester glycosidase family protein [Actinomycetales bacterium]|nr:phosphodiester glycosidase family protein [Actinomycetales bacterium]